MGRGLASAAEYSTASRRVSDQAGLIGPKAACETGGIAYWMGRDQFWMLDQYR